MNKETTAEKKVAFSIDPKQTKNLFIKFNDVIKKTKDCLISPFIKYSVNIDKKEFIIEFKNESNEVKNCNLFGFNEFYNDPYSGNKDIKVTNLQGGKYSTALAESVCGKENYTVKLFRIVCFDYKTLTNLELKKITSKCGYIETKPINHMKHLDLYQQQSNVIEIKENYNLGYLNEHIKFNFKLLPNSICRFDFYADLEKEMNFFEYKKYKKQLSLNK